MSQHGRSRYDSTVKKLPYRSLVLIGILILGLGLTQFTRRNAEPPGGRIAFVYETRAGSGVYSITENGTDRTRIALSASVPIMFNGLYSQFTPAQQARLRPMFFADSQRSPASLGAGSGVSFHSRQIGESCEWMAHTAPDGSRFAFALEESGHTSVRIEDPDGGNLQPLTSHPAGDSDPAWSSDGSAMVFASNRDGNWELYTVRADGTHLKRLTHTEGDELEPVWLPILPPGP